MKIEKINDNQIRCTLSKEDLAERQIKLSELAYGSEKAKTLFRDMMQKASTEFGFEADEVPLMVEAIPVSQESIILVITKVEYPDELDTRFSKFSEADDEEYENEQPKAVEPTIQGADDILGWFNKLKEEREKREAERQNAQGQVEDKAKTKVEPITDLTKMFEFADLMELERISHVLSGYYDGTNNLYKNEKNGHFYLMIHKSNHSPEEFNKVCNMLSEYSAQRSYSMALEAHYEEHETLLIKGNAIQTLAML